MVTASPASSPAAARPRRRRRAAASALALLSLLASAAPAAAATQTVEDPNDGVSEPFAGRQVDVRRVTLDQTGDQTTVSVGIEPSVAAASAENDQVVVFFDANGDGLSERGLVFESFGQTPYRANLATTPSSQPSCQRFVGAAPTYESGDQTLGGAGADGLVTLSATFPTAAIGGATSFRWGVYGLTDSLSFATYDYVTDATNPRSPSSGTATGDTDGCDTNGDSQYGESGDERTRADGSYPVDLSKGASFPGGSQPGPGPGPGVGPGNQLVPDPALISVLAPETLRTVKMPDVRAGSRACAKRFCSLPKARALLRKAGLRNFKLVERTGDIDEVPKKLRDRIEHGNVINQSPAPGTEIGEPNVLAYPGAALPRVKVLTYEDPKLRFRCNDDDLAKELKGKLWPGETTGRGRNREYGAQNLLERLDCKYLVTYAKKSGTTEPTIDKVSVGNKVRIKVALPKTAELAVFLDEGPYHSSLKKKKLVGLLADGTMPVTGSGLGGFVVHVVQTTSAPSLPLPGVGVSVTGPTGAPAASARTGSDGTAALIGPFNRAGTYTVTATLEGNNGLSLDGTATLKVRNARSPLTTQSGRRFRFRDGAWRLLVPQGPAALVHSAQQQGPGCNATPAEADINAAVTRQEMVEHLKALARPGSVAAHEEATGLFLNSYLRARDLGFLERRVLQDFLKAAQVSVPNFGTGRLKAITSLCESPTQDQARRLARGYDVKSGPLPVIEAAGAIGLPDGTVVPNFGINIRDVVLSPPKLNGLQLSIDERVQILEAVISTGGGNVTDDIRQALFGVISTGGGNVISTGGGNVIATGGLNLTPSQRDAINRVISTGGGNLTPEQLRALQQCISTGGANLTGDVLLDALRGVISTGGGNLNAESLRVVQAVIATGGGNVIATGGLNLRDVLLPFVSRFASLKDVQSVISNDGASVISSDGASLIGQAGGNLISDKGLGLIGDHGTG